MRDADTQCRINSILEAPNSFITRQFDPTHAKLRDTQQCDKKLVLESSSSDSSLTFSQKLPEQRCYPSGNVRPLANELEPDKLCYYRGMLDEYTNKVKKLIN